MDSLRKTCGRGRDWLAVRLKPAFTTHPHETGETYWQHLWFTTKMSVRFLLVMLAMFVHGVFPFLLVRTASTQMEKLYAVMKSRIPKSRRDEIDKATELDYSV